MKKSEYAEEVVESLSLRAYESVGCTGKCRMA